MGSLNNKCAWPEIFITGEIPTDADDRAIISAGLCAWANCMIGSKPPEHFGKVLSEISARFNITASADGLSEYAKKMGWLD